MEIIPNNQEISSELYDVQLPKDFTTTSGQAITLPFIEHRAKEVIFGTEIDEAVSRVPFPALDEEQKDAVHKAVVLEHIRETGQSNTDFPHFRRVEADESGLLWVCAPEDGNGLDENIPFAAVRSARAVKIIDFATSVKGHPAFFRYDQVDMNVFVDPTDPELVDVNAYAFIDNPRVVIDPEGVYDHRYQVSKIVLLETETDMDYPVGR